MQMASTGKQKNERQAGPARTPTFRSSIVAYLFFFFSRKIKENVCQTAEMNYHHKTASSLPKKCAQLLCCVMDAATRR
jgi:hypothetical protein